MSSEEYKDEPSLHGLLEQIPKEFPFEDMTLSVIVTPVSRLSSNLSLFEKICKFFGFITFCNAFRVDLLKFTNRHWECVATEVVNVGAHSNTSDKNELLKDVYERLRTAYEETHYNQTFKVTSDLKSLAQDYKNECEYLKENE